MARKTLPAATTASFFCCVCRRLRKAGRQPERRSAARQASLATCDATNTSDDRIEPPSPASHTGTAAPPCRHDAATPPLPPRTRPRPPARAPPPVRSPPPTRARAARAAAPPPRAGVRAAPSADSPPPRPPPPATPSLRHTAFLNPPLAEHTERNACSASAASVSSRCVALSTRVRSAIPPSEDSSPREDASRLSANTMWMQHAQIPRFAGKRATAASDDEQMCCWQRNCRPAAALAGGEKRYRTSRGPRRSSAAPTAATRRRDASASARRYPRGRTTSVATRAATLPFIGRGVATLFRQNAVVGN